MRERLKATPSPLLVEYVTEPALIADAKRDFQNMMTVNIAHALMLNQQGIVAPSHTKKLLAGMLNLLAQGASVLPMKAEYEDLFYNIEHYLIADLGMEIAGQLHTARSRNDLGVAVIRMSMRDAILPVYPKLLQLRRALLKLAQEHQDTIITGYTHMQPAQPITLGFYLSAVGEALERDFARLTQAYARLNISPMGSCAFAGTGFDIDRVYMANLLGFDGVIENTMDAVAGRDFLLEMTADLAILGSTINRFTQDLYYWGTDEFGYLEVDNSLAGSSSIMPQKKNPITFEYVKGKSAHLLAAFVDAATVLRGTPFGHCKDMIETLKPFYTACEETQIILTLLTATVSQLVIHKEGMKDRTDANYCTATELSDQLVKTEGLSFRVAYQIVGSVVGKCSEAGLSCLNITTEMLDEAGLVFAGRAFGWPQERVSCALDSAYSVQNKECDGAPGPEALRNMLLHIERQLAEDEKADQGLLERQRQANALLQKEIEGAR